MANRIKSIEAHKRDGTYQKCRHDKRNPPEAEALKKTPYAPKYLTANQREIFRRVAKELVDIGILSHLDIDVLVVYCRLFDLVSNPEEPLSGAIVTQFRGLANDLGLTPMSRERLTIKKPEKNKNEFDNI